MAWHHFTNSNTLNMIVSREERGILTSPPHRLPIRNTERVEQTVVASSVQPDCVL